MEQLNNPYKFPEDITKEQFLEFIKKYKGLRIMDNWIKVFETEVDELCWTTEYIIRIFNKILEDIRKKR